MLSSAFLKPSREESSPKLFRNRCSWAAAAAAAEERGRVLAQQRDRCEFLDGEVILYKLINNEKFGAPCLPPPSQGHGRSEGFFQTRRKGPMVGKREEV